MSGIAIMDIAFRQALQDDIPRMYELLAEIFSLESDFTPDNESEAHGPGMLVNDPSGMSHALVAVRKGTVIGMVTIQILISTAKGGRVGLVEDVIALVRSSGAKASERYFSNAF